MQFNNTNTHNNKIHTSKDFYLNFTFNKSLGNIRINII